MIPGFDLFGRGRVGVDIHFGIRDVIRAQPGAGAAAIRAPRSAVHDHSAVGQRPGYTVLRLIAYQRVHGADLAAQFDVAGRL